MKFMVMVKLCRQTVQKLKLYTINAIVLMKFMETYFWKSVLRQKQEWLEQFQLEC